MEISKGKSVMQVPGEDIFSSKFFLHIDCIKTRNLEGRQQTERRGCALLVDSYHVSVSLEENLVYGRHWCKDTHDIYKSIEKKQLRWDCEGIWFKIDLMKIHVSELKLEVIQHFDVRREEVGTSSGTRVVGRARIPLWDFLKGDKMMEELVCGNEKRSNCVQLGKMNGSGPKAQGALQGGSKKPKSLEELLGGDEKRSKCIHLAKMEGCVAKALGVLQVDMTVEKFVARKRKRKRSRKQAASHPNVSLRHKLLRAK